MSVRPYNKSGTITREMIFERSIPEPNTGCWIWTGSMISSGYGQIWDPGTDKAQLIHRISYQLFHGEITEGLQIDHKCRLRLCCNPDHLRAVTQAENILCGTSVSAINAKKKFCKHGHEFTPENTAYKRRGRQCRTCHRLEERKRRQEGRC